MDITFLDDFDQFDNKADVDKWRKTTTFGNNPAGSMVYYKHDDTRLYILEFEGEFTLRYDQYGPTMDDEVIYKAKTLEAAMALYKLSENNPKYSSE